MGTRLAAGHLPLVAVLLLYAVLAIAGINWGLPSRDIDGYLFGRREPWSGQKIYDLSRAAEKSSDTRGADVDADPLAKDRWPVPLTDTEQKVAAIYLRYRLYTYQPDEMITMMALSRMRPGEFDFDPGLYQYGGLFIYPVGALIRLCGAVGLIDVRGDLVYYLDHPDQFGRFYVAARAYVAAWGLVGIVVVYLIGCRLGDHRTGLVAALLGTLLPIIICMSHEAKPHLPGAVLMLLAVWLAMRYVDSNRRREWWLMVVACGAAFGMVLSSLPVFILIPFVEWLRVQTDRASLRAALGRAAVGVALAAGVYLATNPYVPINLVSNRAVLASNFSNSLAMYEVARAGEGLERMVELTAEGASWPVVVVGVIGIGVLIGRRKLQAAPLAVVAGLIFVQFVLLGAGKPAEYGRFGLFTDLALAIAAACALTHQWLHLRRPAYVLPTVLVALSVAYFGYPYLANFMADASPDNTRLRAAAVMRSPDIEVALLAEPAPYSCPPMDFAMQKLWLFPSVEAWREYCDEAVSRDQAPTYRHIITTCDTMPPQQRQVFLPYRWERLGSNACMPEVPPPLTPISWANKPLQMQYAARVPAANGESRSQNGGYP